MQDNFYKLIYEVKYNPVKPSIGNEQVSAETPVVKLLSVYFFFFSMFITLAWNRKRSFVSEIFVLYVCIQVLPVNGQRQATITDIMPGVEYLIQVRAKEEFDGQWSEWSPSTYAKSWTGKFTQTQEKKIRKMIHPRHRVMMR